VKAFLDAGLLPRVIAGTSAGGLVAAMVCTHTDAELKALLVPELARKLTACEDQFPTWIKRFWTTGARFDSVTWARKVNNYLAPKYSFFIQVVSSAHFLLKALLLFEKPICRRGASSTFPSFLLIAMRELLNCVACPTADHLSSPTMLLNYMTAPDTIIWSALLASTAVPGILNPVVLMQKLSDGRVVPWNWGISKFKDGSLR
jgi:predicted acylesterase/phospholipase RssA